VLLLLLHPEVANRSCESCHVWLYDEKTGRIDAAQDGTPLKRPRVGILSVPPCKQPKRSCPKGTPEDTRSLTAANEKAYRHYLECRATNQWPDDALVRRHAGIIFSLEQQVERARQERLTTLIEATLGLPR
jgi:hypothetical protein